MVTRGFEWTTHLIEPSECKEPWKKSTGEACPHGHEIFLVDGPFVRNEFSSDLVQGDNFRHSPKFVPKGELWLDASMPEAEMAFVALHECMECCEFMAKGMDYEDAHDRAQAIEDAFRSLHRPGEE